MLDGSTRQNFMEFSVLPMKSLYKKIAIMYKFKCFIKGNNKAFFDNKRQNIVYNVSVKYANKSFGQFSVDYLGPTYFNLMPYQIKKEIYCNQSKIKNIIYRWLF